jgi:DNA-binding HxlR family transcriptional regulator
MRPGKPARGTTTGRPIMVLLDLLGRRWALRILWELRAGPVGFRGLQERVGSLSPTILSRRLSELRAAGILVEEAAGNRLTHEGEQLLAALAPLAEWAARWGRRNGDR